MRLTDWAEIGRMDDLSRLDTPVHRLDARAKALATLVFIGVVMSFPRYAVSALTPFFLFPVSLLALGRIPPGAVLRKLLLAAPFAVIVGLFNPLLDRQPVASLGPIEVSGGFVSFISILVRFALTVGAALALVACTGIYRLGAGLERMGVPRVFVVQVLFLYRYLFVVAGEGATMLRAVEFRSAGGRAPGLRVYASVVGHLLLRSMDRAERVHRAMVARGFDGTLRVAGPPGFRWQDLAFVCGWALFFAAARTWNLAEALGRLVSAGGAP